MNTITERIALPQENDFRLFLQTELARRCRQNPRYSLRAYAKFLQLSPSFLSNLLNGKRAVTPSMIVSCGRKIGLDPQQTEFFIRIHSKSADATKETSVSLNQLTMDQFQVISDWYHYAILELILIDDFKPDSKWIAKVLGITVSEVNAAIERLCRLELLSTTSAGPWIAQSKGNTTIGHDFTAAALKSLQRQILEKAIIALENQSIEARDQSALTMAMDSRLLPEVKKCIKSFRRRMLLFQDQSQEKDQVYHLSISMYPLLKK